MTQTKQLIGRAENIDLPTLAIAGLPARIDTGARTTSLWASHVREHDGVLEVVLLGPSHPLYTGEVHRFEHFTQSMVASSNGQSELRYKIRVPLRIGGRRVRATVTLADRSTQVYPVLVGRNVLRGKFIVDVQLGEPLLAEERQRSQELQSQLSRKGGV